GRGRSEQDMGPAMLGQRREPEGGGGGAQLLQADQVGPALADALELLGDALDPPAQVPAQQPGHHRARAAQRPKVRSSRRPSAGTSATSERVSERPARSSASPTSTGSIESWSSAIRCSASSAASTARSM